MICVNKFIVSNSAILKLYDAIKQEPSNIDDSTVPDLRLDTLGQDNDEFGSFFSSSKEEKETTASDKAILPSQLFDLDQSLFSLQTPRQGIKFLQSIGFGSCFLD